MEHTREFAAAAEDGLPDSQGLEPATVEAVGKVTEALEAVEVARGHLYAFHRLTGTAHDTLAVAIDMLDKAGHEHLAATLRQELLGRNVLPGRWTFQIVEEYNATHYEPFREYERQARELTRGQQHLREANLKRRRRTPDSPGHEATPGSCSDIHETAPKP